MPSVIDVLTHDDPPCMPWGTAFGNAFIDVGDTGILVEPNDHGANNGGCTGNAPIELVDGGIFLEVPDVLPPPGATTLGEQNDLVTPNLTVENGNFELRLGQDVAATQPYDAAAMRWWRLRPDRVANDMVGDYSADGRHWVQLGTIDTPPPTTITIQFAAGVDDVVANPGTARFINLNVCPPL